VVAQLAYEAICVVPRRPVVADRLVVDLVRQAPYVGLVEDLAGLYQLVGLQEGRVRRPASPAAGRSVRRWAKLTVLDRTKRVEGAADASEACEVPEEPLARP
jgi:hypothetical protein